MTNTADFSYKYLTIQPSACIIAGKALAIMDEFTMSQALHMSGVDLGDDPFVQDAKFQAWIGARKYRVVDGSDWETQRQHAILDGIEVLITKDQQWKKAITT